MKYLISLLFVLGTLVTFGQLNYNAKSVYFTNADSATVRSNAAACGDCGFIYYNKQHNPGKFRFYQDSVWYDIPTHAGSGTIGGTVSAGFVPYANGANTIANSTATFAGTKFSFTPSATSSGINMGSLAGDPSSLSNGDFWYNSTTSTNRLRGGGISSDIAGLNFTQSFLQKQTFTKTATTAPINITASAGDPSVPVNGDLWMETGNNTVKFRSGASTRDIFSAVEGSVNTNRVPIITGSLGAFLASSIVSVGINQTYVYNNANSGTSAPISLLPQVSDPSVGITNGDFWYKTGTGFSFRDEGVSKRPLWNSGISIITDDTNIDTDTNSKLLTIGDGTTYSIGADGGGNSVFMASDLATFSVSAGAGAVYEDAAPTKIGITYASDYSADFVDRSLVDKGYITTRFLQGSATLDFPNTTTSVSNLNITLTGATAGKPCYVGVPNGSQTATATFWCWVSAANTVTVRFSPKVSTGEDPASGTFTVTVDNR